MKRRVGACCAALWLAFGLTGWAGSSVSIRLVQAANRGTGVGAGLGDVASVLTKSLPFDSYDLQSSGSCRLPAQNAVVRLGGFSVRCSGAQQSLSITVSSGRRDLLNTNISLRDGKPFVLGGLPSSEGKLILVFVSF